MRLPRSLLIAVLLVPLGAGAQPAAQVPAPPPSPAAKIAPAAGPARSDGKATTPAPSSASPAKTDPAVDQAAKEVRARGLLDINSASEEELTALPGVGEAYAKKIIAGRPYAQKTLLLSRKIVPRSAYEKIKDQIVAAQPKK